MRNVRAAGVQMSPVLYSREGTVDKVVRNIRELGRQGLATILTKHPLQPSERETAHNPASRSAKLRGLEKNSDEPTGLSNGEKEQRKWRR